MPDIRSVVIALVLLALAAGAWFLFITKPKATYSVKQDKAAHDAAASALLAGTTTLHVEGCTADFPIRPGERLEPRVLPGASRDQFRNIYGKETTLDKSGSLVWKLEPYTVTDFESGKPNAAVTIQMAQGHVLRTLDGIDLGVDTFHSILRRNMGLWIEVHERIEKREDEWVLNLSFYSACGKKYRSVYSWTLPSSPETDRLIHLPTETPQTPKSPLNSNTFYNKVVENYRLEFANGTDDTTLGTPSAHPRE